jgi:hypothetical protein
MQHGSRREPGQSVDSSCTYLNDTISDSSLPRALWWTPEASVAHPLLSRTSACIWQQCYVPIPCWSKSVNISYYCLYRSSSSSANIDATLVVAEAHRAGRCDVAAAGEQAGHGDLAHAEPYQTVQEVAYLLPPAPEDDGCLSHLANSVMLLPER